MDKAKPSDNEKHDTHKSIRRAKLLHVWMSGTKKSHRGQGMFTRLFQRAEAIARLRGYEGTTLNTYPDRFPQMYRLAVKKLGMSILKDAETWV
mmetsp:Transcript_12014/g.29578  ORF Transcript_12014/g.29578 Transcript_12014/m.29578 type:complete len:93 (-) Transcript_12014:149-427(-)